MVALAATSHDTGGRLVPAVMRCATLLRDLFSAIAINATDGTHADTIAALRDTLGATVIIHPQNEATIGRARREAVRLALATAADTILYSDLDHLMRWAENDPAELRAALTAQPQADVVVIGRSPRAFGAEPKRLQETERLVNHAYKLLSGHDWDLMFAVRRLSRSAAACIVRDAREDGIANDVEWPLLAERAGFTLGYIAADGLAYRTMEEFGTPADTNDGSALEWIRRLEIAAQHAAAMRPYLKR